MRTLGERAVELLAGLVTLVAFLVLYAPVLISALFSVVEVKRGVVGWEGATLGWYAKLAQNRDILAALSNTALVAVIAVTMTLVLATVLALYVNRPGALGGGFLGLVVYLPFLLPPIVTGLSLLVFFDRIGVARGVWTLAVGHAVVCLAIVYRLLLNRLQALPPSLVEASADLGATRLQTFRRILLPHLASAFIAAGLLALTISFDETLVSFFLSGTRTTLPLRLWAMMRVGFSPEINALATLVLLTSILLTVAVALTVRGGRGREDG